MADRPAALDAKSVAPLAALLQQPDPAEALAVRSLLGSIRSRMLGRAEAPLRIGRYVVLRPLGAGGEGVVYEGYDPQLERQVAVKLLHAPARGDLSTMGREARAMARLNDTHVVRVYDVGHADSPDDPRGVWFVVMELVRGRTLAQWLQSNEKQPWRTVLRVVMQAGRGLASAHEQGLVHRDFKPSNVLVGDDGIVRVSDFGLAALTSARDAPRGGTQAYMAPEGDGSQPVDARADQYAFCVVLWQALFGHRPAQACPVAVRPRRVPVQLIRVLERGLHVDPAQRYPSMQALLGALTGAVRVTQWRRWLTLTGVGALALTGLWQLYAHHKASVCQVSETAMSGVWDATLQRAVRDQLEMRPEGAQSRRYVTDQLDAHAALWRATREQACQLERDGKLDDELYTGVVACLQQNKAQFRGVVQLLATQDLAGSEAEATGVVSPPAACLDPGTAKLALAHPQSATAVAELARVRARIASGQLRLAERGAAELVDRVDEEAEPALKVRALNLWAKALVELDEFERAVVLYRRAMYLAAQHGLTPGVLLARAGLAKVLAFDAAQHDHARHSIKLVLARMNREPPNAFVRAKLWVLLGEAYAQLRDSQASLDAYNHAEKAYLSAVGPDHPVISATWTGQALALVGLKRFALAEEIVRKSFAQNVRFYGENHIKVAHDCNVLAGTMFLSKRFVPALPYLRRSYAINVEKLGVDHSQSLLVGRNLAIALMETGSPDAAIALLTTVQEGRRRARDLHPRPFAQVLADLGGLYERVGRPDEALTRVREAYAVAEPVYGSEHRWILELAEKLRELERVVHQEPR